MPAAGTPASYEGWGFMYSVLVPVTAPMVFMVLMLDALMSRVFLAAAEPPAGERYRRLFWIQLALALAVLLRFLPYVLALGRGS